MYKNIKKNLILEEESDVMYKIKLAFLVFLSCLLTAIKVHPRSHSKEKSVSKENKALQLRKLLWHRLSLPTVS